MPRPCSREYTSTTKNVKDEINKLEKQFEELKNATLLTLIKKGKNEEDLFIKFRLGLASLPGSIHKRHEKFFSSENRTKISRSQSFEEVFAMLGDYWTFLNCSLLLHIIENFTDGDVSELVQSFESCRGVFCHETSVAELGNVWKEMSADFIEVLAVSHHHSWESLTLHEVNIISENLARRASLQPFAFPFMNATPGSVVLIWALPRHLAPLCALCLDCAFLDAQGIDSLQIDGVSFEEFRRAAENPSHETPAEPPEEDQVQEESAQLETEPENESNQSQTSLPQLTVKSTGEELTEGSELTEENTRIEQPQNIYPETPLVSEEIALISSLHKEVSSDDASVTPRPDKEPPGNFGTSSEETMQDINTSSKSQEKVSS